MAVDPATIENPPVVETPPAAPVAPAPKVPRGRAAAPAPEVPVEDENEAFWKAFDARARTDPAFKERLKTHDVVAGIAGSIAETKLTLTRAQEAREAADTAAKAEREKLLDLARNDPDEFAAQFLTQEEANAARERLENLAQQERSRIGARLGRTYREAPEFQAEPLAVAEYEALTKAVLTAKDEDAQLEAYARTMNTFSARRLAKPLAQSEVAARIAEESEAAVAQANANRLRSTAAPPIGMTAAGGNDEPDFRSDYQGWLRWRENQKAQRR